MANFTVFWDLTTVRWLSWELLDCLKIDDDCLKAADDCLAPAWWLPLQMPDHCLMTTYLPTSKELCLRHDYLRTAWKRIDYCQMTAWELLDCLKIAEDCLALAWWLPWQMSDDCLMTKYLRTAWHRIAWWLSSNALLMTAWPLPDDCLKATYLRYFTTETLPFF